MTDTLSDILNTGRNDKAPPQPEGVRLRDFRAYMVNHTYVYIPTGELWPPASVDGRFPPIQIGVDADGDPVCITASRWLDQHRPVEQITWAPGEPQVIEDRLIVAGGWIARSGVAIFNQYRPPILRLGDPAPAANDRVVGEQQMEAA